MRRCPLLCVCLKTERDTHRTRRFHGWFMHHYGECECWRSELYNLVLYKRLSRPPEPSMATTARPFLNTPTPKGMCRFSPTRRVAAHAKVQSPYCTISCNPSTLTRKRLQPSRAQIRIVLNVQKSFMQHKPPSCHQYLQHAYVFTRR